MPVEIGLALPQFDFPVPGEERLRWESVAAWAARAEELGFGSLWLADHLFLDLGAAGGGPRAGLDPLVALGALARLTSRVRLGTLVLCTPLRPATITAKALATLDVLSAGRLVVGLGAGWYEPEFAAAGVPFLAPPARLEALAEAVQVMRGLWGGGPFSFEGTHVRAEAARCLPRPVQEPSPPIWLGGRGDRLLALVAARADGWNTAWTGTVESYRRRLEVLEAACDRLGRDPASVSTSVGLYALVGEDRADLDRRFQRLRRLAPGGLLDGVGVDEWRQGRLVGTVDEVAEQLAAWEALGVSSLVVAPGAVPFSLASLEDLEILATTCRL